MLASAYGWERVSCPEPNHATRAVQMGIDPMELLLAFCVCLLAAYFIMERFCSVAQRSDKSANE